MSLTVTTLILAATLAAAKAPGSQSAGDTSIRPFQVHIPQQESWARKAYPTLNYFHEVERGGHFAAWEQPELLAEELRAAFKPLR